MTSERKRSEPVWSHKRDAELVALYAQLERVSTPETMERARARLMQERLSTPRAKELLARMERALELVSRPGTVEHARERLIEELLSVPEAQLFEELSTPGAEELRAGVKELRAAADERVRAWLLAELTAPEEKSARSSHFLLATAVRLLPQSERARYLEEFRAELLDVPDHTRLRHALSLLRGVFVLRLRHGFTNTADDAAVRRAKG